MSEQLLIWILPGYFGYLTFSGFRVNHPIHKGNWDFVIQLSVFSAFSYWISQLILTLESNKVSITFIALSTFFSILLGFISALAHNFLLIKKMIPNPFDLYTQNFMDWVGKPILLVLKSNKIYVGLLLDYDRTSRGENISDRTLTILPIKSGHRHKETFAVTYTNSYESEAIKEHGTPILIPIREIESMRLFQISLDSHFSNKTEPSSANI
jgi:hypothetical protein